MHGVVRRAHQEPGMHELVGHDLKMHGCIQVHPCTVGPAQLLCASCIRAEIEGETALVVKFPQGEGNGNAFQVVTASFVVEFGGLFHGSIACETVKHPAVRSGSEPGLAEDRVSLVFAGDRDDFPGHSGGAVGTRAEGLEREWYACKSGCPAARAGKGNLCLETERAQAPRPRLARHHVGANPRQLNQSDSRTGFRLLNRLATTLAEGDFDSSRKDA